MPLEEKRLELNPRAIASLRFFSMFCAFVVILTGLSVLTGWTFDIVSLKSVLPNIVAMNPMTACAFILSGISIMCLCRNAPEKNAAFSRIAVIFSGLVAGVGLCKILGYLFHFEIGIDRILFHEKLLSNQMAPNTAANFFLLGAALGLTRPLSRLKLPPSQLFSLLVLISSFLAFLGYAYGVKAFYGVASFIPMALNTTICFMLLALAALFLRPASGITSIFVSESVGGILARKLLPACVVVPALLGIAGVIGEKSGFYDKEFRLAVVVMANTVVFTGFVWWLSVMLYRVDIKRKEAEDMIRQLSLTDELTGLYNRRGFQTLAGQQLKTAQRAKSGFMIVFADMDGLKQVNDAFGHKEGDRSLIHLADILKRTFRTSDILARFAGDEFAVLALDAGLKDGNILEKRLKEQVENFNARSGLSYKLSVSAGVSYFDGQNTTIESLMSEADKKLYDIKRGKKKALSS